jgi:hypothetical protein
MSGLVTVVIVAATANRDANTDSDAGTNADADGPRSETLLELFHLQGEAVHPFMSGSEFIHRLHLPRRSCDLIRVHFSH